MLKFKISKFLSVILDEDLQTKIFIDGKEFIQCSHVLVTMQLDDIENLNLLSSVDEIPQDPQEVLIPPKVKFFVHCSNLQAWAENNYDTRMIHSNLAFPLLKKLTEVGDLQAERVFKEEIIKRIKSNYPPVVEYLIRGEYTELLSLDDFSPIIGSEIIVLKELKEMIKNRPLALQVDDEDFVNGIGFTIKDQKIEKLNLINCSLTQFPEHIEEFSRIHYLNLDLNMIRKLNDNIGYITSLETLTLHWNKLTSLHENIGNLDNLVELTLSKNQLISLPESIGRLTSLKDLYLEKNNLEKLPESINQLSSLEFLNLSDNNLSSFPELVLELPSLRLLWLKNNRNLSVSKINNFKDDNPLLQIIY